ncbi:MAG TPA: DUF2141 domain-containing protein [Azospirillaceae bacterium]|nr:DUF2141 domain-containing protein [Azospirillaceae bacterium]
MKTGLRPLVLALAALGPAAVQAGEIRVTVKGVRSAQGKVMAALYDSAEAYAGKNRRDGLELTARPGDVQGVFITLPPGRYGIAVYHDENGNGKLDYNLFGVPLEGFGFSRDAVGDMAPPSFDATAFTVDGNAVLPVGLTLRY